MVTHAIHNTKIKAIIAAVVCCTVLLVATIIVVALLDNNNLWDISPVEALLLLLVILAISTMLATGITKQLRWLKIITYILILVVGSLLLSGFIYFCSHFYSNLPPVDMFPFTI